MAPTPRSILLLTLVWAVPSALSDASQHIHVATPTLGTTNHSQVRLRQMRSAGDEDTWFSRLARGDSQEVPPPFWANRGRRDMADLLHTVLAELPERDARGGRGSEELPPFWANRGRRQDQDPLETLKTLLASSGGIGDQTSAMDLLQAKLMGQYTEHGVTIPLRYLDQLRGNNTRTNSVPFVHDVMPEMLLNRVYREGSLEDGGPFWANRGRRDEDENGGQFWANRGRRDGEEFVPFYANRGRREGEEFVPFYANRGRREGEEFVPFYANRGRREGEEFVPFYANRGRREGEEFVPFYANRGRREGEESGPFWANRGRREEERTGLTVVPRQNHEELLNYPDGVGPFWANRGRREEGHEEGPFWANRGRREDVDEGPFWANRGRSVRSAPHKAKRMRRQDPVYADEPQWVVLERREKSMMPVNLEPIQDDPFWIARGKRHEEQMREIRGLKESLSNEDQPFWPTRGRRDLRDSLSAEEPFWALRGRRGLLDSLSKEDPFWATRGRRGHVAELSREMPVWTFRGKKSDDKEMVGRGRRFSGSTSATRALGAQDPNFWPVRGKRTHDPGNEEDNRFWDTLERKYQNKNRTGNATNQTNKASSRTDQNKI